MIFDTKNLNNLTIQELGLLLLLYNEKMERTRTLLQVKDVDIENLFDSLQQRGYITSCIYSTDFSYRPPYRRASWSLLEKGRQLLSENCVSPTSSRKKVTNQEVLDRCASLAPKLMALYPMGNKPGTSLKWRGSEKIVAERLCKLINEGNEFTDEEAINATKNYVSAFNGMYTQMRILPYFLWKNRVVGGEVDKACDFMSYVEDLRTNNNSSQTPDWDVKLC